MRPNRVFAIRLSQEWVEVRAAFQPPKAFRSRFEKPVTITVEDPYMWGSPVKTFRTVPKKLRVITTYHVGGTILCCLKVEKFKRLTKMVGLTRGAMKELPPQLAQVFLDPKWRKQHVG